MIYMQQEQQLNDKTKKELKQLIDDWRAIDDGLKEANRELRGWKQQKKEKEELIMDIINGHDIQLDYDNELIVAEIKDSFKGLNKKYLLDEIKKTLGDEKLAEKCVENIYNNREVVERQVINRKKKKTIKPTRKKTNIV